MPPKSFEIETPPDVTEPKAPPVADLAKSGDQPPAAAAPPPAERKPAAKAKPDTAGIDQFLKAQIGSDRYKEVAKKAAAEAAPKEGEGDEPGGKPTPERGPDGKFLPAGKKKDKEAEKKPEKKAEPATPPKPPPFKPKVQPAVATPLTAEQIVAAASEGAARALAGKTDKADAAAADTKADEPKLEPEQQDRVEILTKMEEMNPTKYKGLASKYKSSLLALDKYAKDWEAEHPGQSFDEDSPEHEDFFKKNDVDWSDLDFQKAIARLVSEDVSKKTTEQTTEQLAELKRAETLRQKQGEIAAEQNTAALAYWRELGDDYADVVNPDGSLNMAKITQLKESDGEALQLQITAAQALDLEVAEIYKLFNLLVQNDPKGNPIHRNINQFAAAKEQEFMAMPIEKRINPNGKEFLPAHKFYSLPKVERERYFTFSARDLALLRADELAKATRTRVEIAEEQHKAWARRRGIQLEDPNAKPETPSLGGESRMAAVAGGAAKTASPVGETFLRKQLRGS